MRIANYKVHDLHIGLKNGSFRWDTLCTVDGVDKVLRGELKDLKDLHKELVKQAEQMVVTVRTRTASGQLP